MAGAIGGGGLGDIAIRYGYQRFQADIMIGYNHHLDCIGTSCTNDW